jgi:hypothetical protein
VLLLPVPAVYSVLALVPVSKNAQPVGTTEEVPVFAKVLKFSELVKVPFGMEICAKWRLLKASNSTRHRRCGSVSFDFIQLSF